MWLSLLVVLLFGISLVLYLGSAGACAQEVTV
jgi:hypothetical protein